MLEEKPVITLGLGLQQNRRLKKPPGNCISAKTVCKNPNPGTNRCG